MTEMQDVEMQAPAPASGSQEMQAPASGSQEMQAPASGSQQMQAPASGSQEMQAPASGSEASAALQPDLAMASTGFDNERVEVLVEVCMKPTSTACPDEIRIAVERMLQKQVKYDRGPLEVSEASEPFISQHVESIQICETDENSDGHLWFWRANINVKVYQLSEDGPREEEEEEGSVEKLSSFQEWWLPAREFQGLWESLIYEPGLKNRLLRYSETALLFSDKGVDANLVSWNRVILLHGPPGTGKTSLCKALAQKLSIRHNGRYQASQLIEVNAHALFSRWFSESSKLVARLFQSIRESAEGRRVLVFVLIDEVESLAAAREAARSGSEPADAIRVVNAVLTQLDRLKNFSNVIVLTTSNLTGAIDVAFVDRADIKAFIGLPTVEARYEILRSCIQELQRTRLVAPASVNATLRSYRNTEMPDSGSLEGALLATAEAAEGLSARMLRKLPFLAYASMASRGQVEPGIFLAAMKQLAEQELSERSK